MVRDAAWARNTPGEALEAAQSQEEIAFNHNPSFKMELAGFH
jgi:hypothetical protein